MASSVASCLGRCTAVSPGTPAARRFAALPVPDLLADDAIVFFWTTNSFLADAITIGHAWGLKYYTLVVWAKDRPGLGRPIRGQSEPCLVFTQGNPLLTGKGHTTVLRGPVREHSRKPDEFFDYVDTLCHGAKLELFAREARPGWKSWGAETDKFGKRRTAR